MFDKETDKACLISSYDGGYDKYLNPLLESIRFKRWKTIYNQILHDEKVLFAI